MRNISPNDNITNTMAEQEAKLSSLRQSLREGTDMAASLHTLNTLLEATTSNARIQEIASFLSLQLLFECLSTVSGNEELLSLTCAVVGKIFSALPADEICRQRLYLELGLQHESEEVRQVCLNSIYDHLAAEEVRRMVLSHTVFHLVTQVVGDDSLQCASLASDMLLSLLEHPDSLDPQLKSGLILDFEALVSKSDTVCFRVYELMVNLSKRGEAAFRFSVSTGLLQRLVEELSSGDVLVQMNCVELLLPLLEVRVAMEFLESQQVVSSLHSLLLSAQQDPLGATIIPSVLKFYGHISLSETTDFPALNRQYPEFLQTVLSACLSPEDDTQWGVAVDTLGLLGSSQTGREALEMERSSSRGAVKVLGGILSQGRSEHRVRVLHMFSVFFSCSEGCEGGWSSEQWFHHLQTNPLSVITSILKQPFDDLCTGGLQFLQALAPHEWGQKEMSRHPGLLEYLLDRHVNLSKTGKELKFDIVHTLVGSSTAETLFGSPNFLKLRKYDREGPFFATGEQAVAMDESAE